MSLWKARRDTMHSGNSDQKSGLPQHPFQPELNSSDDTDPMYHAASKSLQLLTHPMKYRLMFNRYGAWWTPPVWHGSWTVWIFLAVGLAGDLPPLAAQDFEAFEIHVRPVLLKHCVKCHGEQKAEGGLRLTRRQDLLQGGDSGPALIPGKPDESLLVEAIHYESLEMPPEAPLSAKQIAAIESWIADGAPWPDSTTLRPTAGLTEEDRQWWCIQPITDPVVPPADPDGWCKTEIDRFIYARLAKKGLRPAAEADRATLVRRLHFDVTGLPPSASQLTDTETLDQLTSRLLADSNYGVNQARFWLDLVRYADSDGYNADHARPEAAQYRDYVIRSFNDDKPYDQFVREQLAGDEINPGDRDSLVATMYLRHWIYEWNQRDVEGQWAEILSDITETTSDAFLGLSLKCARCHDHKFDPLLQKDYFELLSFFAPLQPRQEMPLANVQTRTDHFEQQKAWEEATREIRAELHAIERPVLLQNATREGFTKFVPEIRAMIEKPEEERTSYEQQIAVMASRQFDVHPEKLSEWLTEQQQARRQELLKALSTFDELKPEPLPTVKFVASDVGPVAPPTFIPDIENPEPLLPGFPDIIDAKPATIPTLPVALQSTGRRTALAQWITDSQNPLTARVIVNRVWAQHFGRGLVETVSEFGHLGSPPTHPELLDWLATRLIEDGWSLKKLHQRILNSATWQQTSTRELTAELASIDPRNTLYWRREPRRLSAEEIIDTLQAASGELSDKNRAVYRPVRRNKPDPQLGLFDFPGRIRSQGERHLTTTPSQALMLMNNSWTHERARAMERKLTHVDTEALLQTAYERLYFRSPTAAERDAALNFLQHYEAVTPAAEKPRHTGQLNEHHIGINLKPAAKSKVQIPWFAELPEDDFSVQAIVQLRSLYPDASVRTLVANWSGNQSQAGWSLGVTSTKSAYQPKNLILQLVGTGEKGELAYEVVPSNLRLELNKPYFVAVSVDLDDTTKTGITFYLKDLSSSSAPLQVAQVTHKATGGIKNQRPIEIGGRSGNHLWDGLVSRVALFDSTQSTEQIKTQSQTTPFAWDAENALVDLLFNDEQRLGQDQSGHRRAVTLELNEPKVYSPREQARISLLHALMNSNETLYID